MALRIFLINSDSQLVYSEYPITGYLVVPTYLRVVKFRFYPSFILTCALNRIFMLRETIISREIRERCSAIKNFPYKDTVKRHGDHSSKCHPSPLKIRDSAFLAALLLHVQYSSRSKRQLAFFDNARHSPGFMSLYQIERDRERSREAVAQLFR